MNAKITPRFSPLFISLICIIAIGCGDEAPSTPNDNIDNTKPVLLAGRYTLEELIGQYNGNNVAGVIELYNWNYDILRQTIPGTSPWESRTFVSSNGEADFFDVSLGTLTSAGIMTVNDVFFKEIQTGIYQDWSLSGEPKLETYFGTGVNEIFVSGTDEISPYQGTVSFSQAPLITNISRGQQVSRSADLPILWTGSNSGYVEIGIDADNAISNPQEGQIAGIVKFIDNTGTSSLSVSGLQKLPNGIVEVYVWQYDPVPITLSNGQQVYVVGMSIHEVSIELVN